MPHANLLTHRDHYTAPAAPVRTPRRHRRSEPDPHAAAALQRALDRRDNGGATGHGA
ncbi:hypothetical protein [Kitasatospora sp. MAP5-34]|uniref:hypothetical protein n=1 Tax=Kitasatospora sp. MAP5-34 TaxID=3035102 RepID=UPI002474EFE9|nr:hypothetical protein [Kitasatospora sp. MAP5-34]MDH6579878.1 hypothetical protein [Kitasatospora sp. MAP5-34]